MYGLRGLPESVPRDGVFKLPVEKAAKLIADLATTAPHRFDPDVVLHD